MATKRLGYLQQHILVILRDISTGKGLSDVSYYGGSITNGQRCISIGRECTLYYDVPWEVIDLRHAGKLFWMEHQRLGVNTTKTFNRAVHSLISRGIIMPVSLKTVFAGERDMPHGIRLRFVRLVDYA